LQSLPTLIVLLLLLLGVYLEISVDDESTVHVFQTEDDLSAVEADFSLGEDSVLRQMIVQVAAVHQVENEAQLVRRLKRVRHADDERTAFLLHTPATQQRLCYSKFVKSVILRNHL